LTRLLLVTYDAGWESGCTWDGQLDSAKRVRMRVFFNQNGQGASVIVIYHSQLEMVHGLKIIKKLMPTDRGKRERGKRQE